MALHSRLDVLNAMVDIGVVPVFYNGDVEVSKKIIDACAAGGARVIEFTNRGDFAYHVFTELSMYYREANPGIILGVGSVIDAGTTSMYIASGANFIVSPILNPEMAKVCNRRKIAFSPGCGSLSEISLAEELGAEIVKIFPGSSVGGPAFVKAIKGPCPWTSIMPTGGVSATKENITEWFEAGVTCVGMGSKLITKDAVAKGDFASITQNVKNVIGWIEELKGK